MCSGLPEQGLADALETSGDKAAAVAAATTTITHVMVPLRKQGSSRLGDD